MRIVLPVVLKSDPAKIFFPLAADSRPEIKLRLPEICRENGWRVDESLVHAGCDGTVMIHPRKPKVFACAECQIQSADIELFYFSHQQS